MKKLNEADGPQSRSILDHKSTLASMHTTQVLVYIIDIRYIALLLSIE